MESNKWYTEISQSEYVKLRNEIDSWMLYLNIGIQEFDFDKNLIEQLVPTTYEKKKVSELFERLAKDLLLNFSKIETLIKVNSSPKSGSNRFTWEVQDFSGCELDAHLFQIKKRQKFKKNIQPYSFKLFFDDHRQNHPVYYVKITKTFDDYFFVEHWRSPTAAFSASRARFDNHHFYRCDGLKGLLKNLELLRLVTCRRWPWGAGRRRL